MQLTTKIPDWLSLAARLKEATGPDAALDEALADAFGAPAAAYTGSVEECHRLLVAGLPGWHPHVGFGASGVFPYALLSRGSDRAEAEAPTVPLAILRAAVDAKRNG